MEVAHISEAVGVPNRQLAEAAANLGFFRARRTLATKKLPELLAREKVFVSARGSSIQVLPHVYNTMENCDRLIACLCRIAVA